MPLDIDFQDKEGVRVAVLQGSLTTDQEFREFRSQILPAISVRRMIDETLRINCAGLEMINFDGLNLLSGVLFNASGIGANVEVCSVPDHMQVGFRNRGICFRSGDQTRAPAVAALVPQD